jgi:DNA-binding NarL/FixJ family response regulator
MTRVLLAEDEKILRQFMAEIINNDPDFEVVTEAAHGMEAVAQAERHRPDLALVDWYLPLLNGYDAARIMLEANRLLRVVIMSGVGHHRFVMRALRAGVRGYFLKSEEHPQRVLPALRTVVGGEIYLTPSIASLRDLASYPDRTLELLTPRLRQILQLIAERMATKEIARLLGLSERTVESHRLRIMDKLGIRDRVGLIHYAYEEGLVRYRALDGLQDSNPFPR